MPKTKKARKTSLYRDMLKQAMTSGSTPAREKTPDQIQSSNGLGGGHFQKLEKV